MTDLEILDQLGIALYEAKREENRACEARIEIEQKIIDLIGAKEEGTTSISTKNFKLRVVGKLYRKVDWDIYDSMIKQCGLPEDLYPDTTKRELNLSRLKKIKEDYPSAYQTLTNCMVIKPAKTYVSLQPRESE